MAVHAPTKFILALLVPMLPLAAAAPASAEYVAEISSQAVSPGILYGPRSFTQSVYYEAVVDGSGRTQSDLRTGGYITLKPTAAGTLEIFGSGSVQAPAVGYVGLERVEAGYISGLAGYGSIGGTRIDGSGVRFSAVPQDFRISFSGIDPNHVYRLVVDTALCCGAAKGTQVSGSYTLSYGMSPVPLPAALPLFGAALAALGGLGRFGRKNRSDRSTA